MPQDSDGQTCTRIARIFTDVTERFRNDRAFPFVIRDIRAPDPGQLPRRLTTGA